MTVGAEVIPLSAVRQHNKPDDAWCAIHGDVYELTKFSQVHPGGDIILLAAGKEATVLYETYHVRGVQESMLKKYKIGTLPKEDREGDGSSYYSWDSEFYKTLRKRVVARLKERGVSRRGGPEIWIKAILLLAGFWASLYYMCTLDPNGGALLASVSLGTWAAFVGVCIQHDGNHGAFAFNRYVNKAAGWTLDMIGACAFTWEFQHVLGHHPYTNLIEKQNGLQKVNNLKIDPKEADQESDPDVFSTYPFLRLHPWHVKRWYHRYQHYYAPFIFGFMTMSKVFSQDAGVALRRRLFQIDAECRYASFWNRARFWGMKVATMVYMLAIPMASQGVGQGIKLFLLAHFTAGEVLATMFIVNHIIEGVSYASKDAGKNGNMEPPRTVFGVTPMAETQESLSKRSSDEDNAKPRVPLNDWAAVQCQTSVNWSIGSWFWNHFSGGLNHQIEHHLFPGVVHTAYYHINDVVRDTCHEFGVPYQHEPSLWTAYWKMLSHLKTLGNVSLPAWEKEHPKTK